MHLFWPIPPLGGLTCIVLGFCLIWLMEEAFRYQWKARIRRCDVQLNNLRKETRARKQISPVIHEELQRLRFNVDEAWEQLGSIKRPDERQNLPSIVEHIGQYCDTALRIQRVEKLAQEAATFESCIERLKLLDLLRANQEISRATLEDASFDLNREIQVTLDIVHENFRALWASARGEIFEKLTEANAQNKLEPIRDLFKRARCFKVVDSDQVWRSVIDMYIDTDDVRHSMYNFWEQSRGT